MPVFLYTLEQMRRAQWLPVGDAQIWPRVARMVNLSDFFVCVTRPPGVHKFRTMEEMNAFRKSWPRKSLGEVIPPPGRRSPSQERDVESLRQAAPPARDPFRAEQRHDRGKEPR